LTNNFLVATLGNPGPEYAKTRHNIGHMVFDKVIERLNLTVKNIKIGSISLFEEEAKTFYLYKPLCYMNESGFYIKKIKDKFSVASDRILIIHDDKDLPFGKIKFKSGGGSAGHRGVASIVEQIGKNFIRLKLGIGVENIVDTSEFVLSKFSRQEQVILEEFLMMAAQSLYIYMCQGLAVAMNLYNGKMINV
jgi:PTH1 family peptidyl-tRNA hydrolase